jgi:hypothetical protein
VQDIVGAGYAHPVDNFGVNYHFDVDAMKAKS